jgi:hypothetical protein
MISKCPKCQSEKVFRSRRRNKLEHVLYWLGLRPWRCEECKSRFFLAHPWFRNRLPKEHRRHDRSRWRRIPLPHRVQIVGYALGIVITLVFLGWLAVGGLE